MNCYMLSMECKNLHDSNCTKVRFVAYFLQILQKPLFTDTADTIFMLYFELYQLRNALGISTAEKKYLSQTYVLYTFCRPCSAASFGTN